MTTRNSWPRKADTEELGNCYFVISYNSSEAPRLGSKLQNYQITKLSDFSMRYLPKSPAEREQMLREIGARSIDDLFSHIPAEYRLRRDLKVPGPLAESEIIDYFRQRAAENANGFVSFLGAGAYNHYRPVVIDALVSRGEFFTAYTPYQAEIAQGTLQAIFEFQTMICELTGMEVANASMYDGSTAVPEAVMMAARVKGRPGVAVAKSLHPEYRDVLRTFARNQGMPVAEFGYDAGSGQVDL